MAGTSPAMTSVLLSSAHSQTQLRDLAAGYARALPEISLPSKSEGAGNAGRPMRPIVACAKVVVESTRVSQVTPESPGLPRAMVYGLFRALPGDRLSCRRHPRKIPFANLMPASGHQDHTTSPSASSAFVKGAIRVHRVPSRVCDDRETPLFRDGMANHIA
jgi:hypothetical protein